MIMKLLFSFGFVLFMSSNLDLQEVRKMYAVVAKSETDATEFITKMESISLNSNPTFVAYKGAATILKSKLEKKVAVKMSRFKEGAKLIEMAVANEPENIEIRLIRLSIQENVPLIVGYRKNKKEDKTFILSHYKEQSNSLMQYLKNFMVQSKSFSEIEKQTLK